MTGMKYRGLTLVSKGSRFNYSVLGYAIALSFAGIYLIERLFALRFDHFETLLIGSSSAALLFVVLSQLRKQSMEVDRDGWITRLPVAVFTFSISLLIIGKPMMSSVVISSIGCILVQLVLAVKERGK